LNIGWERTVVYGNKVEFAKFKVNQIMGEGEALEIENLVSSK
jgi:hypothetical protein